MRAAKAFVVMFVILSVQAVCSSAAASIWIQSRSLPASVASAATPEPGTRLLPSEHVDHVPIFINGTSEFLAQHWPGSGSEMDPFVINGFSIRTAISTYNIRILNTYAYFVIRDCNLTQTFGNAAVHLGNTSHGRIEFTTVSSNGEGVHLSRADNTYVSYVSAKTSNQYPLYVDNSTSCHVEWNAFTATSFRVIGGLISSYLVLGSNVLTGSASWYGVYLVGCHNMSSSYDTVVKSYVGFYLLDCDAPAISHANLTTTRGASLNDCPRATITSSIMETSEFGISLSLSPGARIAESEIVSAGTFGVSVSTSNNVTMSGIVVGNTGSWGIALTAANNTQITSATVSNTGSDGVTWEDSHNVTFASSEISHAGGFGLRFSGVEWATISNNVIFDTDEYGVSIESSNNGQIAHNIISGVGNYGVSVFLGSNWTISDNTIDEALSSGIIMANGANATVQGNHLSHTGSHGIEGVTYADLEVVHNTLIHTNSYSIDLTECDRASVIENTLSGSNYGISAANMDNATFESNSVDSGITGVGLVGLVRALIKNNVVTGPLYHGIYVNGLTVSNFTGNVMSGCGFYFEPSYAVKYYNHTMSDNLVNGRQAYYGLSVANSVLDASSHGQTILVDASNVTVLGGHFVATSAAAMVFQSQNVTIDGLHSESNYRGVIVSDTLYATITSCVIDGIPEATGIWLVDSLHFVVQDTSVSHCAGSSGYGIRLSQTHFGLVNTSVFDHNRYGVYADFSQNITVFLSTFSNTAFAAVYLESGACDHWFVRNSTIVNATYGVRIVNAPRCTIEYNEIRQCSGGGVYSEGAASDNVVVHSNRIESCRRGVYVLSGADWTITNNTILWSWNYGVWLSGSTGDLVYYNTIGLSGTANGYDNTHKHWDDTISRGNNWSDYSGVGAYAISGGSATTDRYPYRFLPTEPIIDSPLDLWYAEFSTGHKVTWTPYDDNLRDWKVYVDSQLWGSGAWNYHNVTVNVDGLAYGTHVVTASVWDIYENTVSDTLIVHVYDGVAPTMNHPPDLEAFTTGSGQTIDWQVYDSRPGTYQLFRDEVEIGAGDWTSGVFSASLDGLTVGPHSFVLYIYDLDRNAVYDGVDVLVVSDTDTPTVDSPADIAYFVGSTGNTVVWTPSDNYPLSYWVNLNDAVYVSGDWSGSKIALDIDGLQPGAYTFVLVIQDGGGHTATDIVAVTVLQVTSSTTGIPPDLAMLLILGVAIGGVILVLAAVLYLRKRGKGGK